MTCFVYESLFALLVQQIKYSKNKYKATEIKLRKYKNKHMHTKGVKRNTHKD